MDLKSLIAKMDQIESKKFLTESEKKDSSWTDMKGNKHTATKVKGKSYGNQPEPKEVDSEGKAKKKVKEGLGIFESLMEEFGLGERVTINPDGSTSGGLRPQGASNWQNDVTIDGVNAAGEFKFSPEQEKWLGGADRQDPYILNRMPGVKPPISYFKDPENQAIARQLKFPSAQQPAAQQPAAQQPAAQQPAAPSDVWSGRRQPTAQQPAAQQPAAQQPGAARSANDGNAGDAEAQAAQAGRNVAGSTAATTAQPDGPDGSNASAPAQAATNAAGSPLKWPTTRDEIIAFQRENGLQPDGLIGNQTMAALTAAGATPPAGFRPVANRRAPAPAPQAAAQQAAMPAQPTNPQVAKIDAEIARFTSQGYDMNLPANQRYVARLQSQRQAALNQPATAQQPARTGRGARPRNTVQQAAQPVTAQQPAGQGRLGPTRAAAAGTDPTNPLNQPTREDVSWLRKLAGL